MQDPKWVLEKKQTNWKALLGRKSKAKEATIDIIYVKYLYAVQISFTLCNEIWVQKLPAIC